MIEDENREKYVRLINSLQSIAGNINKEKSNVKNISEVNKDAIKINDNTFESESVKSISDSLDACQNRLYSLARSMKGHL